MPKPILLRLPPLYTAGSYLVTLTSSHELKYARKKKAQRPGSSTVERHFRFTLFITLFLLFFLIIFNCSSFLRHDLRNANSTDSYGRPLRTLFPANGRPSQPVDVRASTPQSVQTSSQKAVTPALDAPITEGVRGGHITGKNDPRTGGNSGGPTAPASLASTAADSTLDKPTETEKKARPSQTEIAAIKRRCAASLVALMPRTVARTFFGVPSSASPPYSGDGTCSTNSSPCLATPSPPSISGDGPWPQGSDPLSSSHSAISTRPSVESGGVPAERLRTDEQPEIDLEALYLTEIIENDLLDVFADEYCNKHLVYSIIEVVLAKILPEMTEHSVRDLMEDRGVTSAPSF
ncbi:unnamed protein product [Penicillium salamii]|uniref:Uncharacterized protein n=1 Tax=Penicillium salamii TaxID=1612424 RepID=A0A9W4NVU4_9EURO|nr:unnamed protein product [Penicillium salamii]